MNKTHQAIIHIWTKELYLEHPSYTNIAKDKRVKRSKSVVAKVIQEYERQNKAFGLKEKL